MKFSGWIRDTYVIQDNQRRSPTALHVADGVEDTVIEDRRNQLLKEQYQQATADGSEVEVVNHEKPVQLEGWTAAH